MTRVREYRASCSLYLPHLGRTAQLPPEVAERVATVWAPGIVDHNVLYYFK